MIYKLTKILKSEGLYGINKRLKARYGRIKRATLSRVGKNAVMSQYGVVMKKNWRDDTFRFCISGSYGYFLSNHIKNKKTMFNFLDIGANQGLYTLTASQNPNCVNATCFEPVKLTFLLLVNNIHLNKVSEKCTPLNLGLGKKSGLFNIFTKDGHSGAASLFSHFNTNEGVNEETIEIVTAKIFSDLAISSQTHPITCKIDVEGKEMEVVETLIEYKIINSIDEIFYEVNENWVDSSKLQKILEAEGFKTFKKIGKTSVHYDVLAMR